MARSATTSVTTSLNESSIIYARQELVRCGNTAKAMLLDRLTCTWIKIEGFDAVRATLPKALQNIFKASCSSLTRV